MLHALSPEGRCKTFDSFADGYGRGEGLVSIILGHYKHLDIHAFRDEGHAVIFRCSAINQDGRSSSLSAPHGPSQTTLVVAALRSGKADPSDIKYMAVHGTGTPLGDPIEVGALGHAVSVHIANIDACGIGAMKSCYGHTEGVSGITGLLMGLIALKKQQCPSIMHLRSMNTSVASSLEEWHTKHNVMPHAPRENNPLTNSSTRALQIAGTSSFGLSGVNAHGMVHAIPTLFVENTTSFATSSLPWQHTCIWPTIHDHLCSLRLSFTTTSKVEVLVVNMPSTRASPILDHLVDGYRCISPGLMLMFGQQLLDTMFDASRNSHEQFDSSHKLYAFQNLIFDVLLLISSSTKVSYLALTSNMSSGNLSLLVTDANGVSHRGMDCLLTNSVSNYHKKVGQANQLKDYSQDASYKMIWRGNEMTHPSATTQSIAFSQNTQSTASSDICVRRSISFVMDALPQPYLMMSAYAERGIDKRKLSLYKTRYWNMSKEHLACKDTHELWVSFVCDNVEPMCEDESMSTLYLTNRATSTLLFPSLGNGKYHTCGDCNRMETRMLDLSRLHQAYDFQSRDDNNNIINHMDVRNMIKSAVSDIVGDDFDVSKNFASVGLDSLGATELRTRLINMFNIQLDPAAVFEFPTVSEMSKHIKSVLSSEDGASRGCKASDNTSYMAEIQVDSPYAPFTIQPRVKVFCFHGHGSSLPIDSLARDISKMSLPKWAEVYDVCVLGKGDLYMEKPFASIVDLGHHLLRTLPLGEMPYALVGYSQGCFTAMELARIAANKGVPPLGLFLISPFDMTCPRKASRILNSTRMASECMRQGRDLYNKRASPYLVPTQGQFHETDEIYNLYMDLAVDRSHVLDKLRFVLDVASESSNDGIDLHGNFMYFDRVIRRVLDMPQEVYDKVKSAIAIDSRIMVDMCLKLINFETGMILHPGDNVDKGDKLLSAPTSVPVTVLVGSQDPDCGPLLAKGYDESGMLRRVEDGEYLDCADQLLHYARNWQAWCQRSSSPFEYVEVKTEIPSHFFSPTEYDEIGKHIFNKIQNLLQDG